MSTPRASDSLTSARWCARPAARAGDHRLRAGQAWSVSVHVPIAGGRRAAARPRPRRQEGRGERRRRARTDRGHCGGELLKQGSAAERDSGRDAESGSIAKAASVPSPRSPRADPSPRAANSRTRALVSGNAFCASKTMFTGTRSGSKFASTTTLAVRAARRRPGTTAVAGRPEAATAAFDGGFRPCVDCPSRAIANVAVRTASPVPVGGTARLSGPRQVNVTASGACEIGRPHLSACRLLPVLLCSAQIDAAAQSGA